MAQLTHKHYSRFVNVRDRDSRRVSHRALRGVSRCEPAVPIRSTYLCISGNKQKLVDCLQDPTLSLLNRLPDEVFLQKVSISSAYIYKTFGNARFCHWGLLEPCRYFLNHGWKRRRFFSSILNNYFLKHCSHGNFEFKPWSLFDERFWTKRVVFGVVVVIVVFVLLLFCCCGCCKTLKTRKVRS